MATFRLLTLAVCFLLADAFSTTTESSVAIDVAVVSGLLCVSAWSKDCRRSDTNEQEQAGYPELQHGFLPNDGVNG